MVVTGAQDNQTTKATAGDIIYITHGEGGSLNATMTVAGWLVLSKANGAEFWEGLHLRVDLRARQAMAVRVGGRCGLPSGYWGRRRARCALRSTP